MGCCFSSTTSSSSSSSPTAIVIAVDGSLTEHSVPVTVSKVLGIDHLTCFLCNSDSLSFDTCIPYLHSDDILQQDQIYFVLPKTKLRTPLTGADMAALAVKASSALALASQRNGKKRRQRKISVVARNVVEAERGGGNATIRPMRQRSAKSGRSASSWAKALRRSLRRTLSKIEEEVDEYSKM